MPDNTNDSGQQDSPVIRELRKQLEAANAERDAVRHQLARTHAERFGFNPDDFIGRSVISEYMKAEHDWSADSFGQVIEQLGAQPPAKPDGGDGGNGSADGGTVNNNAAPNAAQDHAFGALNRLVGNSGSVDAGGDVVKALQKAIEEAKPGSHEAIALRQQLADIRRGQLTK